MSIHHKIVTVTLAAALATAPVALAAPAGGGQGSHSRADGTGQGHPAGQGTSHPAQPSAAQRKAYGQYCQAESKKHSDAAPGTHGTPFSQCVTAMVHVAKASQTDTKPNPHRVCAAEGLSKKRSDAAPGTRGTPYSQCVRGAEKLIKASRSASGK